MKRQPSAELKYQACGAMTNVMLEYAANKVRELLYALLMGKKMEIEQGDWEQPGFPHTPHNKWKVSVDGWVAFGKTLEEAECHLLALLMCRPWFPLYTGAVNSGDKVDED